ncbi:Hypothetical predicted protein [Paramuricea clavata]|uniref:Uncharacterized protein n=1 Tax=Paramuricea clavata TaxID=317549 RepID=A0A6S7LT87_PARCT|nr:Hypothetical predicted protein [Paramuricea clavata]
MALLYIHCSCPWLCGAYGLTAPTKKIARPHIYLTVKRGMKKSDVRRNLEDKFKCDAKEYFELLQEPKRKPKLKLLGRERNKVTSSATSVKAVAGGGVFACIKNSANNSNPLRVLEENEREDIPVPQGIGTLTMFCAHDEQHYALTCFHVGCATDENCLNAALNKKDNIQEIRNSLPIYEEHAKEQQYYFAEKVVVENNNENNDEPITFGDDGSNYTHLGDFHKFQFDSKCDILSLKVSKDTEIDCKILGVTSPNWTNIWDEIYERVFSIGCNPVIVAKRGFSSAETYGHIVSCDFSSSDEDEFQDAIIVEGYSGPFLKGGDSGSLVFFHDKNDQKQVLAYGVCELDELPALIKPHESAQSTTSINYDSDGSSIWDKEDYSCSSNEAVDKCVEETEHDDKQSAEIEDTIKCQKDNECEDEFENRNKRECGQDKECKVKSEEKNEYECGDEHRYEDQNKGEDQNKSEDESGDNKYDDDTDDQSDFEVVFQEESTGPYFICLRLDTALENLGLDKAPCYNDCGGK